MNAQGDHQVPMNDHKFRLPPIERANPSAVTLLFARVQAKMQTMMLMAMGLIALPSFTVHYQIFGSVSLTDFTQIWAWLLVGGFLILGIGLLGAYFAGTGVGPRRVITVAGVAFVFMAVAFLGATLSVAPTTGSTAPANLPQAQFAVSLPFSASYPTGQTLNLAPLSVTIDTVMNASTAAGAMCLQNGAGAVGKACAATAHNYAVIPVKISRLDNFNQTAGATICINTIPTLTNASTGITFAPLGYAAATSSSPGIWKTSWSTGSIGGSNPTQPAPQTLTGVACDLVGVPAFGSVTVTLSFALPGSNSTSANFGYLATQYAQATFQLGVTGGLGATPASIPVNMVFTGIKN